MVTEKSTTNVSKLCPNCCICLREFGTDVEKFWIREKKKEVKTYQMFKYAVLQYTPEYTPANKQSRIGKATSRTQWVKRWT